MTIEEDYLHLRCIACGLPLEPEEMAELDGVCERCDFELSEFKGKRD